MKRTLVSLLSLLALSTLFTLSSCKKETTGNGTQFHATMESRDGKTVLNGTALNWVRGDEVAIYGTAGCGIYTAMPQDPATVAILENTGSEPGDGPFRAFYPTLLTTDGATINLPATQTYVEGSINGFPMYAESATNQLAFRNLCGVLKLHLTKANTSITSISVTANAALHGNFTISNMNGEPVLNHAAGGTNTVVLSCSTPQTIADGKDFYITLPATFDSLKSITLTTDDGRYCIKTVKSTICINVERNTVTEIALGENDLNFVVPLPEGALAGLFSVSATQLVRFSQGNLQYQASTDTWRFAEHQYDYVGNDNENIGPMYNGWIDLFGWGTGNNPTNTSTYYPDYSTFVDWGINAISNGGGEPNTWRTLNRAEWLYLLNSRDNASAKKAVGRVEGIPGLILLPDTWTAPEGISFIAGRNGLINNSYSLSEWAAMESAGAVFLPEAGRRWTTSVAYVGEIGYYWTSTPYDAINSCGIYIEGEIPIGYSALSLYNGRSVRLILDNE